MSDCITYDLTTFNNDCLDQEYGLCLFLFFSQFKVLINIHGYPNQIYFAYVAIV